MFIRETYIHLNLGNTKHSDMHACKCWTAHSPKVGKRLCYYVLNKTNKPKKKKNEDVGSRKEETFLKGEIKGTEMKMRQKWGIWPKNIPGPDGRRSSDESGKASLGKTVDQTGDLTEGKLVFRVNERDRRTEGENE